MFDPSIGRWTSEDPSRFAASDPNLYRDVGNNPTTLTDPSGLQARIADQPPDGLARLHATFKNYDALMINRVFTLGKFITPKFTVSAALEDRRKDDSEEAKKQAATNPSRYLRLSVNVDPTDMVGKIFLKKMQWVQIGRTDRYADVQGTKLANAGVSFPVGGKRPTEDAKTEDNAKMAFGATFLDGPVSNSPAMTDTRQASYRRTETELTFWDAPDARSHLSKDFPYIKQNYTALLLLDGKVLYQVDWSMSNYWNNGKPSRAFDPPKGFIPNKLPEFVADPKASLYRYHKHSLLFDRQQTTPNPVKEIPKGQDDLPTPAGQ